MTQLQPSEVLFIPKRRRLTHGWFKNEDGQDVLHLFYGEVELIFDEADIVPFGQKLLEVEQFRAEEAMAWSNTTPHTWGKICELLESLLEQQVLMRVADAPAGRTKDSFPERLGEVPPGREPVTFSSKENRCPVITEQAFGRAFDLSNLEVLVPIYRVAHPALDADGRQVGENNVMPRALFLDLPTLRRQCNYAGSRYQHERPMNVSAMKSMSRHWPELLSLTEQFRSAVVARLARRGPNGFTAGEIHTIAVCMLASVGYVMVRGENAVPNGQLDSGLSSMFRLVDGVRLVTNDLVRALPGAQGCETPITAQTISDYAEQHGVYLGAHGVCAGPPALIDEYLRVLTGEAAPPIDVEPSVATRLGDIDAAIDYGLLGQRVESVVRYLGAAQGLLHEQLRAAFAGHLPRSTLQDRLEAPVDSAHYLLLRDDFPLVETFNRELDLSRWLFSRCGEGLSGKVDGASLDDAVKLDPEEQAASSRRLAEFFAHGLAPEMAVSQKIARELAAVSARVFALERRCLRLVEREQATLNHRLSRPSRSLTSVDLAVFTRPRNGPPLAATLAEGLGLSVTSDTTCTLLRSGDRTLTFTDERSRCTPN